ncbi:hypothetical protein L3Y34_010900 [Caenorhabditis briggsae]|uniref:Uncharacterized protein n=1 Tax=Caenorhabditis briggsae TaxID=6238 RepID=A0AAE9CTB0_CAEBR|nr:hypothetical protein L3Y34_010900 [Caenorhabditis briggsae]
MEPDYATVVKRMKRMGIHQHGETADGIYDYELRRKLENKIGIKNRRHLVHIMDTFNKAEIVYRYRRILKPIPCTENIRRIQDRNSPVDRHRLLQKC